MTVSVGVLSSAHVHTDAYAGQLAAHEGGGREGRLRHRSGEHGQVDEARVGGEHDAEERAAHEVGRERQLPQQREPEDPGDHEATGSRHHPFRATAPQGAGTIHTDFERGFIRAEVYRVADLEELGSEKAIRERGRMRTEGKAYIVRDGDVCHFLFNR